jgi:hypothetical protein
MAQSFTTENLRKVFTYPFEDPKWIEKFLIGCLLMVVSFLLLPTFIICGYSAEIIRTVIQGAELSLPEWDQWDKKLADGLKLFVIGLVYMLPLALFFIIAYALLFAGGIGLEFLEYGREPLPSIWIITTFLGTAGGLILFGIGMVIALATGVVMPAVICHVIATDDLSAAFRFREWWDIFRANLSGFVISYLLMTGLIIGFNFLIQILNATIILCCFVPFIMIIGYFYILTTMNVLMAQAYREGTLKLES